MKHSVVDRVNVPAVVSIMFSLSFWGLIAGGLYYLANHHG